MWVDEPRLIRIEHPRVQHTVELEGDVVGRDRALAGNLDGGLLEGLDVCNAVDKGDQDGQTGL